MELILDGFYKLLYRSKQQKEISLSIPESVPIRGDRSRMLRESRKGNPAGGVSLTDSQCLTRNLGKRETMDIVKAVHDLALVTVLYAIVMAPRAIDTYLARRK